VLLVLAVHIPALALVGVAVGRPTPLIVAGLAPIALLALAGAGWRGRVVARTAAALGLIATSGVYAAFTGALAEARLHVLVVLALTALNREPVSYACAVAAAVATQAAVALQAGASVGAALVSAGLVMAAAAVNLWWWRVRSDRAAASLEEAERVKRELVAVVSHEFRTPLTSIRGYAQTLEERGERMDASTVWSCLRAIEGESRRLERLVDNVVVASGSASGKADADREATADLRAAAATVLAKLGDLSGEPAQRVAVHVEPGLGVRMRATAVALVLENLLDNALKFGDPGTQIRLDARRDGSDAVIEVTNRGKPIREQDLERIFHPFVQGDSSDSRAASGMGLGLATVRRLVTAHGGRVEARNTPGAVTIAITLPAADVPTTSGVITLPAGASTA
jgi:two-component system OmpR family sensor kinase